MEKAKIKKLHNIIIVVINVISVIAVLLMFVWYNYSYHAKLHQQNIADISNINESSAKIASVTFGYQHQKLSDKAQYIEYEQMSYDEMLNYIYNSISDDSNFEIIGTDCKGVLVNKKSGENYIPVSYSSASYGSLRSLFQNPVQGKVAYTPEFTDSYDAVKSFAFYTTVTVNTAGGKAQYTIMYVYKSQEFLDIIHQNDSYDGMSTVLMDNSGNYIIGDTEFKSSNFFKYIYLFNGMTLDDKTILANTIIGSENGTLNYKDSAGRECVFVYYRLPENAWYSVTSVPLSSFHNTASSNAFITLIAAILGVLMVLDVMWLQMLNRQLKISAMHEKEANAAKTDFLSRMSHDMRTPLNAILGFTTIAQQSADKSQEMSEYLDKINLSGHYLLNLINDVLDMSKIESGKIELHYETVDAMEFLASIAELFKADAELKGIILKTNFNIKEGRCVVIDPLRSKQLFSNLLSNAIKFYDSGTTVSWSMDEEELPNGNLRIVSSISDHGCGMSQEFMSHLFEPFMQEQNKYSAEANGTGLGLAIVRKIATLMGGTIEAESTLGEGSKFIFRCEIKIGNKKDLEPQLHSKSENDKILLGKRILVCEDNALNRQIACALLDSRGIKYETAENGQIGVEMFQKSRTGYYDAILMDIRMPVMNGFEATKAIRTLIRDDAKTVPIIAMTANAYDEDIKNSLDAGMNCHLAKPVEPQKMFEALAKQLKK